MGGGNEKGGSGEDEQRGEGKIPGLGKKWEKENRKSGAKKKIPRSGVKESGRGQPTALEGTRESGKGKIKTQKNHVPETLPRARKKRTKKKPYTEDQEKTRRPERGGKKTGYSRSKPEKKVIRKRRNKRRRGDKRL